MTTPDDAKPIPPLNLEQRRVIIKVLRSHAFQMLIGAEEWDLTEPEEETLWQIIKSLE